MSSMIFVNLPVSDVAASRTFFAQLGYAFDERFCDENAICLQISDQIYAMLLRRDYFAGFTPRPVADAHSTTEALIALTAESREAVDELLGKAVAAGAKDLRTMDEQNAAGHTYMYGRSYADLDGHIWEILWMEPSAA